MAGNSDGKQAGAGLIAGGRVEGVLVGFVRSFAGSGVGGEALRSFAAVGLDRGTFEQFRHEGYSAAQIADNARDMEVLGFHGKEEAKIAQHAPTDLRKAAVNVEKAKTPEQKAKAKAIEADKARHYEALPDSDPRKARITLSRRLSSMAIILTSNRGRRHVRTKATTRFMRNTRR